MPVGLEPRLRTSTPLSVTTMVACRRETKSALPLRSPRPTSVLEPSSRRRTELPGHRSATDIGNLAREVCSSGGVRLRASCGPPLPRVPTAIRKSAAGQVRPVPVDSRFTPLLGSEPLLV
eukprot:scaffold52938_cov60-Phaeocystis_antarctica.AAC.2